MKSKRNAPFGGGRGIASGAGLTVALIAASRADAQAADGGPGEFVSIDALEGVQSYEALSDGTLRVVLADGRTIVLPAGQFVSTEAGLFVDLPALSEAMTAGVVAGVGGSPLLMPFLAVGGAGAALAAAAGGGGGGGSGDTGTGSGAGTSPPPPPPPPAPPPPPPPPSPPPPTPQTNSAPVFTSGTSATVAENSAGVAYRAVATDADENALTYSLSGTDAGLFSIDGATGAVTFRSSPDFERPGDAGGDNVYDLVVSASDGTATTNQTVAISVTNVNDVAPVFVSGGAAVVAENSTGVVYTAVATDPDGSALTYSLSGADAALFDIDAATGAVTFRATPDFEAPRDVGGDNRYDLIVSTSDGVASVSQSVVVSVTNVNDVPPVISGGNVAAVAVATAPGVSGSIAFVDGDLGGAHVVSVVAAGAGYVGSFDAVIADTAAGDGVGAIGWSFAADAAALAYLAAGETRVQTYTVTLSDGVASVTRDVVITITGTNEAPVFSGAAQSAIIEQGETGAAGSISFSDRDLSDSHTVSVAPGAGAYVGVFSASASAGKVDWAFAVDSGALQYLVAGETLTQTYAVTVSDGHGGSAVQTVTIYLNGQNDAPTITSAVLAGAVVEDVNTSASGIIAFTDPDAGSVHTVSVEALGAGYLGSFAASVIDASAADGAGQIGWTFAVDNALLQSLGAGEVLTQTYAVKLHDGPSVTVTRNVTVTITGANDAPVVSGSVVATNQGMAVSGVLAAGDVDGDALAFSVHGAPSHGTLTLQANGAYVYTPAAGYHGADGFTFAVSDGHGGVTTGAVSIDVARGDVRVDYSVGAGDVVTAGLGGTHDYPQVAALAGGGHVVAWSAIGADINGEAYQAFVQRYDAAGVKAGAPIVVENYFSAEQSLPTVAATGDGGFVLAWQGYSLEGMGLGIFAQRYDASGAKVGGEIIVNSTGFLETHDPSVTVLASGGFAVSWTGNGLAEGTFDVWARVFDAHGDPVGADFVVNADVDGDQRTQGRLTEAIAGLEGGRFAVVFVDQASADGSGAGVYVRLFEADGTPATGQLLVNTETAGEQAYGSVTALAGGGFVVTWTGVDGDGTGVFAQLFDADGAKVGSEIQANTGEVSDQHFSKVQELAGGGFVIVWQSDDGAGAHHIAGQSFDADGVKLGAEFAVSAPAGMSEELLSMAVRADGVLVLAWRGPGGTIEQTVVTGVAGMTGDAKALVGGDGPDSLLGWDKVDVIGGGAGDDRIAGLGGADVLTGGAGKDTFVYGDPAEGGDTITDFVAGEDRIEVSSAFAGGTFAYDAHTGELFWDRDGGGRVLVATLTGAPAISAGDIVTASGVAVTDLGVIGGASGATQMSGHLDMPMTVETLIDDPAGDEIAFAQPALLDEHGWQ